MSLFNPGAAREIERGGTSEFRRTLEAAFPDWTFNRADNDLKGSFDILHYYACGTQTDCGAERTAPVRGVVGAFFDLKYNPQSEDPVGETVHWIQRVVSNHSLNPDIHGNREDIIDVATGHTADPYYDSTTSFADSDFFVDRPGRIDPQENHDWFAELYLVQETAPQTATIYNGVRWGWKNQVIRRRSRDPFPIRIPIPELPRIPEIPIPPIPRIPEPVALDNENQILSDGYYYTDIIGGGIRTPPTGYVPNDDRSFGSYPLGFPLTYFGNTYTDLYINNNGNISLTKGVSEYTPVPLNITDIAPIIAPYWADVDTRGTGTVSLRTDIPNELIITWDQVGYYRQHTDKLASFQLVLRGPDYPIPADEGNIGFFYKNVEWETGDASGGSGGFGGTQATVGFGDGAADVNPGEFSLAGSQQAGISQLVSNKHLWFYLRSDAGGTIEGSSQENPLLPTYTPEPGVFILDDVFTGAWVDPPSAFGFEYVITSPDSLFTKILNFPTGIDADNLFTVWVEGRSLGQFGPGNSVDFVSLLGGGVSAFTITGIDPLVDPANPTAFPLQLAFNTPTASLLIEALQAPTPTSVPEPSSVLGLFAFSAFGVSSLLRRKQQHKA